MATTPGVSAPWRCCLFMVWVFISKTHLKSVYWRNFCQNDCKIELHNPQEFMANNSERISTPPAGLSGDVIILVVFLFIGGIMFAAYLIGLGSAGGVSPTATATLTPSVVASKPMPITPPNPSVSPTETSVSDALVSPTVTPLVTSAPSLKPSTDVTEKETTTPTITATSTVTGIPTITPTPAITPAGVCATADPGQGLPVSDDTWIESAVQTAVHGADTYLSIRADSGGDRRILLKFNISSLSGSSVASAKLYFFINTTSGATIFLYKPVTSWKGTEATWESPQFGYIWAKPGGDYNPLLPIISTIPMAGCRVELDVTTLVQDWFTTPSTNKGVILIASGSSGEIRIPSSRATANGPALLVTMNP